MKNIFILWILTSLLCLAADTNINYATLDKEIADENMPGMVLSAETNFLKSGVWISGTNPVLIIRNGEMVDQHATVVTLNTSTNKIYFWYFWPSTDLQFQIKLVDDKGNEVTKTAYGEVFGRPPKQNPDGIRIIPYAKDPRRYGLNNMSILPQGDFLEETMRYNPIRSLPKCFEIENPGNYKLTLTRRIYVDEQRTSGLFLKPITFSPVTVDVRVEK
jgi:hypothetical protein